MWKQALVLLAGFGFCLPAQKPAAAPTPSGLRVVRPVFHQGEGGAALPAGYEYVSGEPLYLSFRIAGYKVAKDRVDLRWQMFGTDPDGLLLFPAMNGAVRDEVSFNDENWLPRVQQTLALPPQLPGGEYKLKIRLADELGKADAEQELSFRVRGPKFEPPGDISIRRLVFLRDEAGSPAVPPVMYMAGSTVWVRFDIVAYQLGERNKVDVEYGVTVLRPSGKVLYEQALAAAEQESPFYPKRQLQGGFSLNTTPDLSPGEYTMVVQARDKLSGKQAEARGTFRIEK